jgi:PhnB protein
MKRAEIYKAGSALPHDHGGMNSQLLPKLLVSDADAAITFYTRALEAEVNLRVADDHGAVNHAELALDSAAFALAQSVAEWGWNDPRSMGGSPVLIMLTAPDPDATADRMVQHGAELVIPVDDRPYGKRQGRVRDPFGHLWVIGGELRHHQPG